MLRFIVGAIFLLWLLSVAPGLVAAWFVAWILWRVIKSVFGLTGAGRRHGGRPAIPIWMKREVWQRDHGKCRKCGSRWLIEYDHIYPYSRGGPTSVKNLQLLCRAHNRMKGAKLAWR